MRDKIVVLGAGLYAKLFEGLGSVSTDVRDLIASPEKVALVLFTGGSDVHPSFYGGTDKHNLCVTNYRRDAMEKNVFDYCRKYNVKMTGICRGFQFLNVMSGGTMYQHINGHATGKGHGIHLLHLGTTIGVTSTHHQLVQLDIGSSPIAWASPSRSEIYIGPDGNSTGPASVGRVEIEAATFSSINAMGVQYHPEFMREDSAGRIHYISMMRDFIEMDMNSFIKRYSRRRTDDHIRRQAGD